MSKIFPVEPPPRTPRSEMKVREALASIHDIVVLHSVAWQGVRRGRQADGEADFVVLAPNRGIAILEVKGGGIEIVSGQWYSTDGKGDRHRIKNPFEQAKDSKYALIEYLREIDPRLARVPIVHGVVLPDVFFTGQLGMSAPPEIALDKNALTQPKTALTRLFDYWAVAGQATSEQLQRITDLLAPTTTIAPPLLDALEVANRGIVKLTQQQIETLNGLRRHRRATILGGAGTGKTVLAIDKACRLAGEGRRVALVCFNLLLRDEIEARFLPSNVEVHTFHGLVRSWGRKAKLALPPSADEAWYQHSAANHLLDAVASVDERYDAVLVDEAQDFAPDWLRACEATVAPDGIVYVFADARQDVYRRSWEPDPQAIAFELSINCRNTRQIATLVAALFNEVVRDRDIDGPTPIFLSATGVGKAVLLCQRTVEDLLIREKLAASQLAVLSDSRDMVRLLRECIVADLPFCTAGSTGIVAETIHRFKGLEREVIVVALSPAVTLATALELLYVGFSRARAALWVIADEAMITQLQDLDKPTVHLERGGQIPRLSE
ncbi:AAA family ATPase [Ralstonia pickettii]|uniref:AAA family ATPase n=1 Tax=Ralstonia pickettii TaxID=329 RepID=A0A7X2HQ82_RALPI|nr:NERD domain-containing protein [Ralstonia pickettii]MRT00659.1 AAA family ATPase [Ralstonia pickettii]